MTSPVRIVVAEDEAIIRLDLVETLAEEGYVVVADTGRGDTAVELVREHQPVSYTHLTLPTIYSV